MGRLLDMPLLDDPSLEQAKSAYDAARVSPRDVGFLPQGLGPNAEAERFGGLDRIRARSRHLHDNNELVDNATESDIDRVIGTGIDDIEPDTGDSDVDDQISALYEWSFPAADRERTMGAADIQALYWREMRQAGECGVRVVMAEAFNGYPMMPAIELIEADRIPTELTGINPTTGLRVRQGVEYDEQWRIVAYHVWAGNPRDGDPRFGSWGRIGGVGAFFGTSGFGSPDLVRVPAGEMRLAMNRRRVRQMRGVPALVSGMRTLRTLDKYIDTSMAHAETAGSVGMIFDVQDASMFAKQANGRTPLLFDGAGNPITTMQGVGVAFRKPGSQPPTTIHLNQPGPQFEPTVRTLGHMASRALNGPYSQVSGNYSTETFASNRANRIDQRQRDVRHQHLGVWNPLMRPYCRLLIQYGLLSGRIKLPAALVAKLRTNPELLYRSNVPTPGEAYVNPAQESSAVATDLESGVGSQIEVIGRRGMSWKRVVRQQAKFEATRRAERRKLGLSDYPPVPGAMAGASGGGQDEGGDGEATDLNTGETPEDKRTREKSAGASVSGEDGGIFDGVGGGRFAHLNGHANGVHR